MRPKGTPSDRVSKGRVAIELSKEKICVLMFSTLAVCEL